MILRSPNLVILSEWHGISYNSVDFETKKRGLL